LYAIAASWWLASHRTTTASHGACSPHRIFLKKNVGSTSLKNMNSTFSI
jgi:hypothetical protein